MVKIEEDDMGGQLWFGKGEARYRVTIAVMDGTSFRSTSHSEYRLIRYGNSNRTCHRVVVAFGEATKKALCVLLPGESEGERPAAFGRVLEGAKRYVEQNPNATMAKDAIAAYDGAADAAEPHEIAERAGMELLVPVRINSSAKPVIDMPAGGSPAPADMPAGGSPAPAEPPRIPPLSHERRAALRKKSVYKQMGGLDEITPEAEKIFKNLTVREKQVKKRHGSG